MKDTRYNLLKEVGARVKRARETMGYSQERMADLFDVTRSTYCRYEAGKAFPGALGMERLASHCNISTDWLMTGNGDMLLSQEEQPPMGVALEDMKPEVRGMVNVMKKMPLICFEVLSFYYAYKMNNPHVFQREQVYRKRIHSLPE